MKTSFARAFSVFLLLASIHCFGQAQTPGKVPAHDSLQPPQPSKNDSTRAAEITEMMRYEDDYMKNKPGLDVARGKLVMNPYYENYACFTRIDDPSPDLQPRPKRLALKWQISLQVPVVTLPYSNTGFFLAFTNRAAFDLFDGQDSRPVTHKTFMPEGFIRFDVAALTKKVSSDQVVVQAGAQHESNGGVKDTLSLLDSRGINAKFYGQLMTKFLKKNPDRNNRYLFVDTYRLILGVRGFYSWVDATDNPDIVKYIGYLDVNGSYEFDPKIRLCNQDRYLGVFRLDGFFAPGGSLGPWFPSYSLGLSWNPPMFSKRSNGYEWLPKVPLTPYVRFFRGYNQYLIYYNKLTTAFGWGIQLRR